MTCQNWCDHAGECGCQEHGGADESPVLEFVLDAYRSLKYEKTEKT